MTVTREMLMARRAELEQRLLQGSKMVEQGNGLALMCRGAIEQVDWTLTELDKLGIQADCPETDAACDEEVAVEAEA